MYDVNFCCTVLNSLGWLPNLVVQFCPCLKNYCCVCSTIWFLWYFICWTVKSDGDCQLIPSVHKVNSLIFLTLSLNWSCSVLHWFNTTPELYVQGRHTPSSNYSSSLKQFYKSMENFSNMFVAELAVLLSVSYSCGTVWKVCYLLLLLRSTALEWLALRVWVFMPKKSTTLEW